MADLKLTMACGPYDRTETLRYGTVRPEGIDLTYLAIQIPPEIFSRMIHQRAFDLSEMSCALYLIRRSQRDFPFVAIPVFPSFFFRHGFIFVNDKAGIQTPKDLEGKRVGVPNYGQTAAVWIRGILQSEYGVSLDGIRWHIGGVDGPPDWDPGERRPEKQLSIQEIPEGKTLSGKLESGELDALIGARVPSCLGRRGRVRRLFTNFRQVEREYYQKTGIFPIMHTLVIKEDLHQAHPWIAQSVYKAMVEAKRLCLSQMRFSGAMRYTLPWLFDDLAEIDGMFGGDPWPYGLEANRKNLETLQGYLVSQGFIEEALPLEELFTPILGADT